MKKNKNLSVLALQFATTMLGKMKPQYIKKVERYLKNPTVDRWNEIAHFIIDGSGRTRTIWNAVRAVDPFFPGRGRCEDRQGNIIREWEQIPTPETVVEAINTLLLKPTGTALN